jgi:DNA-binding MarR family transcriptional regulator
LGSVFDLSAQHVGVDARIVATLERLSQVFRVRLREEAREHNLSPIQAQFMIYLLHHDVELRRVSQLAREFDLTQATVSDAVASLETKGFVRREQWPEDRRVVTLRLTPNGEKLASTLSNWADPVSEHLERFSLEEREAVMCFLMELAGSLQKSGLITVARMCVTCRFFGRGVHPGAALPHHCGLLDVPLGGPNLRVDCSEHEAAAGRTSPASTCPSAGKGGQ